MKYIKINPDDNVAVALQDLQAGDVVEGVTLLTDVPRGHKVVLRDLAQGENVIKYGFPIGHVTRNKEAGTVVDHTCIKTNLEGLLDYKYTPSLVEIPPAERKYSFLGFPRTDGQTGIRNQIWVIPTVGCVNGICEELVRRFRTEISGREGSIDAVVAFPHNYGCSQLGPDHENTRTILADMVHHPNAGGVLVVSLGCENNQLDAFRELVGPVDDSRVRMFATQKVKDEIEYGLQQLREIFAVASKDERVPVPVSELRVGLKCGGSDGLSGITANPLLGVFSDWIVAQGGTTVLTEVPEMFGAETILMNRCQDESTFDKTVSLINDFKEYFIKQGMPV
ncbi:MAG: UxaA family hydrolase, partial [Bacteroidales bacterium]|nr:UxaA family hydrolase [Bacteroidales bacterium]